MTPIPILLYHHVAPDRDITPEALEAQMRWLLKAGYRSLSMDEVHRIVQGGEPPAGPAFAVTFDDGYVDNWWCAHPILERLGVHATYYVVTERVEEGGTREAPSKIDTLSREREKGGFASWTELTEMAASPRVTIGSHTHTHRHFRRRERFANLEDELLRSKALIEEKTGRPCRHLAWPWGDFERSWWPMLQSAGYDTAVTTRSGANLSGTHPYLLKRVNVSQGSVEWLERRLRWYRATWSANLHGAFQGLDRRFKVWWNSQSPYANG